MHTRSVHLYHKTSSDSVSQADLVLDSASVAHVGGTTGLWHWTWPQGSDVTELKRRCGGDLGLKCRKKIPRQECIIMDRHDRGLEVTGKTLERRLSDSG